MTIGKTLTLDNPVSVISAAIEDGGADTDKLVLQSVVAQNLTATARYLQVFDQAAEPVNPNVPLTSWLVAANGFLSERFDAPDVGLFSGKVFNHRCWFVWSSTQATCTPTVAAVGPISAVAVARS